MNDTTINRLGKATALVDVFNNFREAVKSDIAVATLAQVDSIVSQYNRMDRCGIADVRPIPNRGSNMATISGYFFSEDPPEIGDMILLVFTDWDFRPALTSTYYVLDESKKKQKHALNFGIIVPLKF